MRSAVAQAAGSFWRYPAADAVRYGGAALWCLGLLAAVWALARAGRTRWPLFFLTLSAVALLFDHPAPPGTVAFAAFFLAAWGLEGRASKGALVSTSG